MRMWMIDPTWLCRAHLLGEHAELHKHRHNFVRGDRMDKRIAPPAQIEPAAMGNRHDALAAEMVRRGYRHQSPYQQPDLSHYPPEVHEARVDTAFSLQDLCSRCPACRQNIETFSKKKFPPA